MIPILLHNKPCAKCESNFSFNKKAKTNKTKIYNYNKYIYKNLKKNQLYGIIYKRWIIDYKFYNLDYENKTKGEEDERFF